MLVTDDHSFYEIMLGAEGYVPSSYGMVLGLADLGQLFPPNATLVSGSEHFTASALWHGVGERLKAPAGKALLDAMAPAAKAYVVALTEKKAAAVEEA